MDTAVTSARRGPWNKGKLVGQKAPLKVRDIWAIRVRMQIQVRTRDLALFDLGIDSKLRGCDSSSYACVMSAMAIGWPRVQLCFSRRRNGQFNLRSRLRREKRLKHGSSRRPSAPTTISSRADCMSRRTSARGNTLELSIAG